LGKWVEIPSRDCGEAPLRSVDHHKTQVVDFRDHQIVLWKSYIIQLRPRTEGPDQLGIAQVGIPVCPVVDICLDTPYPVDGALIVMVCESSIGALGIIRSSEAKH